VTELQEEVTWAWATVVMTEARAARAGRRAWESAILLTSTHGEADKAAQKVTLLKGELAIARPAQDTTEAKFPVLVDRAADADRLWEDAEG
jgi:hypothetical protein